MDIIFGIIIGVIVLTVLVVLHELGHGIVARRNGVVVEEFGIGFPPKARGKKIKKSILGKNVEYTLNWLPLGGFVKLQGENDSSSGKGDYGSVTFWQKTKILLAGVAVNWLTAVVLLTVLALFGIPKIVNDQFYLPSDAAITSSPLVVSAVESGLPGEKAGLKKGDIVTSVTGLIGCTASVDAVCNPPSAKDAAGIAQLTKEFAGSGLLVNYMRDGVNKTATVTARTDLQAKDKKGYIGVGFSQAEPTLIRSTWSAPIVGVGLTAQLTALTLGGLGDVLGKTVSGFFMQFSSDPSVKTEAQQNLSTASQSVAGPVGIFGVIFPAAEKAGLRQLTLLTAIISLTLAVMNALPIPALDGGRWFVTALYRLMKKPLKKETEEKIHGTGFMLLMGLVVLITIADIMKLRQ